MKKLTFIFILFLFSNIFIFSMGTVKITLNGKEYVFLKKGLHYYSGSYSDVLQWGILAKDITAQLKNNTITFRKGTEIQFYLSGKVASGFLSENKDLVVGKLKLNFKAGKQIYFFENGEIDNGYLSKDHDIKLGKNIIKFKKGIKEIEKIQFYENGSIKQGYLSGPADLLVNKELVRFFAVIGFFPDGKIEWGSLQKDTVFNVNNNQVKCAGGQYYQVVFFKTGKLNQAYLSGANKINTGGIDIKFQYRITFDEKGLVKLGVLVNDVVFNNITYHAGKTIELFYNETNKVKTIRIFSYPSR